MDKKVVIIDDESSDRKAMSITLNKAGYADIFVADTGDAGIEMAETFAPDIILVDVVLQDIDGFDVCRQIRKKGSKAKIIMITGHLDAVNADKARNSGADEIIEKTPSFENIIEAIEKLQ